MEGYALKNLEVSEERYKSIFENIRSGVAYQKLLTNDKGEPFDFVFLEVNKAFEKIIGIGRENIIGRKFSEIIPAVKGSMFDWTASYRTLAAAGKDIKFERFLKDVERWYSVSVYSVREDIFITIYDDITNLKELKESLNKAYENLNAARARLIQTEKMDVIGRLTTGITHEIKNPLAIIQQGADYLKKTIPKRSKNARFAVNSIETATKRASDIIKSLLAFSRPSETIMSPESLNKVIESALFLIKNDIARNHIAIKKNLDKNAPRINMDKIRIEQALINIFMNSIQAMGGKGELRISTSVKKGSSGKKQVVFTTEDTGPGIDKDVLGKVFDPFFTTKEVGRGTGLGLHIVSNIIKAHNAKITITNRRDRKGACAAIVFNSVK